MRKPPERLSALRQIRCFPAMAAVLGILGASAVLAVGSTASLSAQEGEPELEGPVGPMPYEIVTGWQDEFAPEGFAFGGNSGVWAESPDRIFVSQRG